MAVTEVNTPKTLDTMGVTALRKDAINSKLRMDVMIDDVYESFGGDVIKDPDGSSVPNSIYLNLDAGKDGSKGANSVTLPLLLHLTGNLILGGATASGNEQTQQMRFFTMYYEEYGYNVASTKYGRNKNEMEMYGIFEHIQPQISIYLTEIHGLRVREASLQSNDHVLQNLAAAGTVDNAATGAHWNSNWFIAGADPTYTVTGGGAIDGYGQPVFTAAKTYSDHATGTAGETLAPFLNGETPYGGFTETLGEVLNAVSAGGAADAVVEGNISLSYIRSLSFYARTVKKIEKLDNGHYVAVLPSAQIKVLKDNNSDTLGEVFLATHRDSAMTAGYTFSVGTVDDIEIYSDDRYPTLLVTASEVDTADELDNANGVAYIGLTPSYVRPGGEDNRTLGVHSKTTNKNFDIGFLYGKAAICEWEVTPVHFEFEEQDYNRNKGTGAFGESGIRLVEYDVDTGWAGSSNARENIGSIALAFTSPSITA